MRNDNNRYGVDVRLDTAYYFSTATPQIEAWAVWCKEVAQDVYILIDGLDPKKARVYKSSKTAIKALTSRIEKYLDDGARLANP